MAKATRHIQQHNEEHYVAKMNFRSEKVLQSQIERLNREKLLQVKSLNAQIRTYERKLQKINDRVAEVEKLSRNIDPSQRLPTREHFNKLNNDALRQRHFATGAGYSYIDQLLGVSRPLVNRPLRWGINPSSPSLEQQTSKPITLVTDVASTNAFMTEIKGHPMYLRPREAVYRKKQKKGPSALILPPIPLKPTRKEAMKQQLVFGVEHRTKPRDLLSEKAEEITLLNSLDTNSQLSPILENDVETPEIDKKTDSDELALGPTEETKKIGPIEKTSKETEPSVVERPEIVIDSDEALPLDKEIERRASHSSSLRGNFITEYEFPSHQKAKSFTRSTELLNVETDEMKKYPSEDEPNSFRYQLHARRFSL